MTHHVTAIDGPAGSGKSSVSKAAAAALGDPGGRPLRVLLDGLALTRLRLPPGLEADVDTVADARRAGVVLPGEEAP